MAVKSQAQRRKFAELLVKGEITPEVYERWNREAGKKQLPERVARKTAARKKPARKKPARKKSARKQAARKSRKKK